MIQNVTIGQYFPGNSFMHRLDARLKLVLTVAVVTLLRRGSFTLGLDGSYYRN